jgi:hypothetical protein
MINIDRAIRVEKNLHLTLSSLNLSKADLVDALLFSNLPAACNVEIKIVGRFACVSKVRFVFVRYKTVYLADF